jgi:RNA-binding protein YlmH
MDPRDGAVQERLRELAARAWDGEPVFTKFLDPREQEFARSAAARERCRVGFFGGDAPLERRVAAFTAPDGEDPEHWPVTPLQACWNARYAQPAHRDFLGALLALGLSREAIGDILVGEGSATIFVLDTSAAFVCGSLDKAGSAALKLEPMQAPPKELQAQQTQTLRISVQSLRLDALVAGAYDLSREQAAQAVRGGLVKLNYAQELRPDHAVEPGAMLSLRGAGRARVARADGATTRSGRLVVYMERFQ